jgi:hypothetical protein
LNTGLISSSKVILGEVSVPRTKAKIRISKAGSIGVVNLKYALINQSNYVL